MKTEIGEYIVGAYLKVCMHCDFVDYNVRPPGGGMDGLGELDVVGLSFSQSVAVLCEVTTHIRGLQYGSPAETLERIKKKHARQRKYAKDYLIKDGRFQTVRFMLWSPVVARGILTEGLKSVKGLDLVINGGYREKVAELRAIAAQTTHEVGNPFFRTLQILEHMRD